MKNSVLIVIGAMLLFAFGMQVFMFYRIHEKLDQRYPLENNLDLSSHQGSDIWIEDAENWNPYQELFQVRDQMEQLFDNSMSRFQKNSTTDSLTKMSAINLKNETDRYVVTADVPGANEYQHRERFSGEFKCSLTLLGDVKKCNENRDQKWGVDNHNSKSLMEMVFINIQFPFGNGLSFSL